MPERKADFIDTIGMASRRLFARHKKTGHRITARMFYGLKGGDDDYEREGYVLMTTKAAPKDAGGQTKMF